MTDKKLFLILPGKDKNGKNESLLESIAFPDEVLISDN
jgi:hypothetical protein